MRTRIFLLALLALIPQNSESKQEETNNLRALKKDDKGNKFNGNFLIGSQAIYSPTWDSYRLPPFSGHDYNQPGFDMLTEFREAVKDSGLNQFKFKLSSSTCASYKLSCESSQVNSLTELSQVPEIAATFEDRSLRWYHMWLYSYNLPKMLQFDLTEEMLEAEYDETYEWAVHMLKRYKGTNKVFFVGNWEGDWQLMWGSGCRNNNKFDFNCAPSPAVVNRYIQWASTRQRAIDDAKKDAKPKDVDIFFYIEFNLGLENMEAHPDNPNLPRPTILNSVVPEVNPDFLSYSSYKSTNKYSNHLGAQFNQDKVDEDFFSILDYAESKLSETKTDFSLFGESTKRVFIGEFGPLRNKDPDSYAPAAAYVFRAAIEWGCPFVLHWETYDNDSNTVPLLPRDSESISSSPLRELFQMWSLTAGLYVATERPSLEDFRAFAIRFFTEMVNPAP